VSAVVRPVGCIAKFFKMTLAAVYGGEMNTTLTALVDTPSKFETSAAL
jgi:hypothetical protein